MTASPDKRSVLAEHEFFRGLPGAIIDRLASRAHPVSYAAGRVIFSKGDEAFGLLAVLSGIVKISVPSEEGQEIVLNLVGEREIFGEIALLDAQPRTADASALTACLLLRLDRRDFLPVVEEEPKLALKLLEVVSGRLRRTSEQVEDISFGNAHSRLAKMLLHLAAIQGEGSGGQRIAITQKELGRTIGLSRESTNKYLRRWHEEGLIELDKGGCSIRDRRRLAAYLRVTENG